MRKLLIENVEEMTPERARKLAKDFKEGYASNEAGTDYPAYYDFKNNLLISGSYHDEDASPFAYFPVDVNGELRFFIKDDDMITTHADLFGDALYQYVYNFLWHNFADKEAVFIKEMAAFGDIVKEENLSFSFWDRTFKNEDTGKKIDFQDFLSELFLKLGVSIEVNSNVARFYAQFFVDRNWEIYDFFDDMTDYIANCFNYNEPDDQDIIAEGIGIGKLDKLYNTSKFEGRIWEDGRLITFYPGQQPSRHELPGILKDICRYGGHNMEALENFYIIFETGSKMQYTGSGYQSHDDATVRCCLVKDYLAGNYEGYDAKAEADMVKNRKGISNFCPHLANQKEKFNYFKAFRDARDKAVYAPREKAAGTLAGYHAMRYPYGEEREINGSEINESLLGEKSNEAGTDHPYYKEANGTVWEANWNDGEGFPFGYWPVNSDNDLEFCTADYGETHAQACGKAAEKYFYDKINDTLYEAADEICSALNDFARDFKEDGYTYDPDKEAYVSADGSNEMGIGDFADNVWGDVYTEFENTNSIIRTAVAEFLEGNGLPSFDDIQERLSDGFDKYIYFDTRDNIDYSLGFVGTNFSDFFEEGRYEGRIWPEKKMIGFYDVAQPNPQEMEEIIYDLGEYMEKPYEYFMDFRYIYEDWDDDDDDNFIKMCTIEDFIYSDVENPDKQYAKDGKATFVPHLASPKEKFNFFKGFRDTRDRAVFAPREKGAGTLAAYHAMRYPYGEERDVNGNLIREEYQRSNEAGTDCPYFYDPETGFEIEGTNDDEDACPFGYFPYEVGGNNLKFFCCEDCEDVESPIHRDIVNSIIMNSINEIIDELTENDEEIIPYLRDLKNDIPSKFDFPKILTEIFEDAGVSYKPTEEFANHLYKYLGMNNWSDDVLGGWLFKDLYDEIYDYWADKDEYQIQMGYDFGVEYGDILYSGRLLGRMWPDKGLITFYPGQQPSREEMKMVITDISSRMGIEYEDLLKFYTIFEIGSKEVYTGTGYKGHDDATVQCCTIAEYIEGKYNGFNREEEVEMVKNRKGIDQLNIHLANQKDKFDYFKNFRDTRDRAVYAPREKGAGTLAAYHAMRYPFGESRKKKLLALVNEEINKMFNEGIQLLREGNGSRAKRQTIAIIADRLGFDADSPYAIDMENRFKTMFFHHGLDCDRYIVFEPNLCRCALDLGFGTNDFTEEDKDYITSVFNLIYKHIEVIEDDKTRQAELKRIKDSITGIDALKNVANELQVNNTPTEDEQKNGEDNEERTIQLQNGYTVIGPVDYDTAHNYGNHSRPGGKLCFSQNPDTWKTYSKNGINTCYILLRDGWENIPAKHDGSEKNCILGGQFNECTGYDNYGTSMIFIFVNPQGNLAFANGRWNHGATWPGGYRCDHEYTEDDITRLIGVPFRKVFKSAYNFNERLTKALERINNGEDPREVFDRASVCMIGIAETGFTVSLGGLKNILYKGKIVSPIWLNEVSDFNQLGLAYGYLGDVTYIFDINGKRYKFSEITQIINNKLMSGEKLESIFTRYRYFDDNLALVNMFGKQNVYSLKANKLISNIWFDSVLISGGIISGKIANKNYFLFEDGKIISEEKAITRVLDNIENYPDLYCHLYDVNEETFCIRLFGKYYYIKKNDNKPVNTKGFIDVRKQSNSRFVWVYINTNERYALDLTTGNLIPENEFYEYIWKLSGVSPNGGEDSYYQKIEPAGEGIFRVFFRGKGWNYIKNGKLMFKAWFKECSGFENGIAKVYDIFKHGWRIINTNGEYLINEGFDTLDFYGKYAVGYDEEENPDYDGDNDENLQYFTLIDLSTGKKIYNHVLITDENDLSNTTLGSYYITDDDECQIVFTKDGQILDEDDYGKLLSEAYKKTKDLSLFCYVRNIEYGYKAVTAAGSCCNILDREGNLVLDDWAWYITDFSEERLKVKGLNYLNYLDENLKPILPFNNPYDYGGDFSCGFARVYRIDARRYYFIDKNGNVVFDKEGYEDCNDFNSNTKLAEVRIDGVYYDMALDGSKRRCERY